MSSPRTPRRATVISGINLGAALVIVAIMLLPLYWAVVTSLKTLQQSYAIPSGLLPPTPTLAAYSEVLHTQGGALLTSLIVAVGVALLSLLIAVPAAHALADFRFRVTGLVTLALLVVQTVPGIVLGMSFFKIFADIRLLNSYPGLIIADSTYCMPFDILVIRAFMLSLPNELLEAAYVDGATLLGSLVRIVPPLSRPAIMAAALFSFLFAWGDFLFALTLNTSGSVIPMSPSIYQDLGCTPRSGPN
jgi:multiple sugar transport system permease protein